ncbi:type I restriction-modification system subunit M N-terminal domain-containing protein [Streptomyces sp. NPDC059814]|uniref:type I restriction-modification system subunit M N-terminal domain-containing protein n=1 Tax=Streptomyces sp. NPDC059814 TaxID=3346959 RepID=UPI003658058F
MVDLKKNVWAVADTLRGVYARNKAGDVILPMTILRRLECVMAPHRAEVAAIIATPCLGNAVQRPPGCC